MVCSRHMVPRTKAASRGPGSQRSAQLQVHKAGPVRAFPSFGTVLRGLSPCPDSERQRPGAGSARRHCRAVSVGREGVSGRSRGGRGEDGGLLRCVCGSCGGGGAACCMPRPWGGPRGAKGIRETEGRCPLQPLMDPRCGIGGGRGSGSENSSFQERARTSLPVPFPFYQSPLGFPASAPSAAKSRRRRCSGGSQTPAPLAS